MVTPAHRNSAQLALRLTLVTAITLLGACASGPGGKASQRQALQDLTKGKCPGFIVYPGARGEFARRRYDDSATDAQLAEYRDREIANCEAKLMSGGSAAAKTLAEYWQVQKDPQQIAKTYQSYLATGNDKKELAKASAELHEMYGNGKYGSTLDGDKAFKYIRGAASYDPETYQLRYADALYYRGHFTSAAAFYKDIPGNQRSTDRYSKAQRCEVHLKLSEMYLRGQGVQENWYLGYLYWLEGHTLAEGSGNGWCSPIDQTGPRQQQWNAERKIIVDGRLDRLGANELTRVEHAWNKDGYQALASISALPFRRPLLPLPDSKRPVTSNKKGSYVAQTQTRSGWPAWRPLGSALCQNRASGRDLKWSELFQLRSGAVWSVRSLSGDTMATGSAVAISPNHLLTNCHIVTNPAKLSISKNGDSMGATVSAADQRGDRCILKASQPMVSYVTMTRASGGVMIGEDVAAIGNPKSLDTSLSRGIVAQKRKKDGLAYLQTDTAISSGSSGGGLFDHAGNLVGITTFKVASGENLNFAIAVEEFCNN
ncbi:MAG: serine protease [Halioglobus sp.]